MPASSKTNSTTSIVTLVPDGDGSGASIRNSDAYPLYVLIGNGTVSADLHTAAIAQNCIYETPPFYRGDAITGVWAGDGNGAAFVTIF